MNLRPVRSDSQVAPGSAREYHHTVKRTGSEKNSSIVDRTLVSHSENQCRNKLVAAVRTKPPFSVDKSLLP